MTLIIWGILILNSYNKDLLKIFFNFDQIIKQIKIDQTINFKMFSLR